MRKIIFYTLMLLLIGATFLQAQNVPTTDGASCTNCVPAGWNKVGAPSLSNPAGIGGNSINKWAHPVASPTSGNSSFLALQKDALHIDAASTVISDLVPGTKYYLTYYVMSAARTGTKYGTSATVKLVQGGAFPYTVTSNTANFTEGLNTGAWLSRMISFTAITEKMELHFDGTAGNLGGFVFLDIPKNAVFSTCPGYTGQVSLNNNSITNECPKKTADLTGLVNGNPPAGATVKWFDNPTHTGTAIADPTEAVAGVYYAFYYNASQDCYNTHNSTAKATFTRSFCCGQEGYIQLSQSEVTMACPEKTVNLNDLVLTPPPGPGFKLVWFTNSIYTLGPPIADPTKAPGGIGSPIIYYAFYYNEALDCYNVEVTNAVVAVMGCCAAGDAQITLTSNTITNTCPAQTVNLNSLYPDNLPASSSLKWFDNPAHTGNAVADPTNVAITGTYYGFIWDEFNNCYNTDNSIAEVAVNITNCDLCSNIDGPFLNTGIIDNTCPSSSVDLTPLVVNGFQKTVVWFDNPMHTGQAIPDPANVAVSGTYYAFFYDAANDCYSTLDEDGDVTVTINACPIIPPTLNLKVKLQGAMPLSGISMRSDLQNYFGENVGLLPTTDPYGFGKMYPDINNISGAAGKVVDWVLVEIRSAESPMMVLQSKVLLLKPNGSIVETDGTQPVFQPESLVHITVRHRNHVAIMSNQIANFQGQIDYDFTTDLSQAFNVGYPANPTAPPQMVLTNGVWCMWAGDIDQNLTLGPVDYNNIFSANGGQQGEIYMNTDINMDGGMDETDMNIIFSNNLVEPYSILSIF